MMTENDKLGKKYHTGVVWQDCQHEEWLELMVRLRKIDSGQRDSKLFHQIYSFLVMYAASHFNLEKAYMETYDYPEKRFHLEEHRLYILRLKDFREKYQDYGDKTISNMIESMNEWFLSHIMENDKKLGQFILDYEAGRAQ